MKDREGLYEILNDYFNILAKGRGNCNRTQHKHSTATMSDSVRVN